MRLDSANVLSNTNCPADDGVGLADACCDTLDVCVGVEVGAPDAVRDALGDGGSDAEMVAERDWLADAEEAPERVCEEDGVALSDPLAVALRVPVIVLVADTDSVRVCVRVYDVLMVCDCVAEKLGLDEPLLVKDGVRLCDAVVVRDADAELETDCEGLSVLVGDAGGVPVLERVKLAVTAWL